jgi:tetratricopeptide (TPR) repeat protein
MKSILTPARILRSGTAILLALSLGGWLAGGAPAPSNSVSELLEKGIYSEQSKGDLDGAIKLYEQLLTEAKGSQALAAQAQYRLGVCLYKKKQFAESTAAFEKLIKDYPQQKELAAQASQYLSGATVLQPAPWKDGEEARLDIKFATGIKIGTVSYNVSAGESNGRKTWQISSRTSAGMQSFSRVTVDADSFKPLQSRWKHTLIGDVEAAYTGDQVELKSAGKTEVKKIDLEGVIYDNEEAVQLMRRLPLEAKYSTTLRFLSSLAGSIVPVKLDVSGPESVEVPAGTFNCYKVELNIRQTFWYSADPNRYLVKFEGGGAIAELASIQHHKAGEAARYEDPTFGFTLSAPAGWLFHRNEEADETSKSSILILDPEAISTCVMQVQKLDKLKPEARKSVRTWAEDLVAEHAGSKEFKLRAESWKERPVAGNSGISVIGDYVEANEKKVGYLLCAFGKTTASHFVLLVPAKDFESMRPKLDAIADSYRSP